MRSAEVRPAAVAGTFYPGFPEELAAEVGGMLADAGTSPAPVPKAIIAPHAGYMYSGAVAAAAYARLRPAASRISRVVLLGPVHRVPVRGLALPAADRFATPLGTIAVDAEAVAALMRLPQVAVSGAAHAQEHSLEVHPDAGVGHRVADLLDRAVERVHGLLAGIQELEKLQASGELANYPLLPATLGGFYAPQGQADKAAACYRKALALASNAVEKRFLRARLLHCRKAESASHCCFQGPGLVELAIRIIFRAA